LVNFSRKLRRDLAPADDRTVGVVERCRRLLDIDGTVSTGVTRLVEAPALHGILRPRLLLPAGLAARLDDAELELVVLHELGHVRRRDLLAQALLHAAAVLHWFNPLAWLALWAARADCEHACDEFVLGRLAEDRRQSYGEVLLKVVGLTARPVRLPAVLAMFDRKGHLKQRIERIVHFTSPGRGRAVLGGAVLASVALVSLTRESVAQASVAANPDQQLPQGMPAAAVPPTIQYRFRPASGSTPPYWSSSSAGAGWAPVFSIVPREARYPRPQAQSGFYISSGRGSSRTRTGNGDLVFTAAAVAGGNLMGAVVTNPVGSARTIGSRDGNAIAELEQQVEKQRAKVAALSAALEDYRAKNQIGAPEDLRTENQLLERMIRRLEEERVAAQVDPQAARSNPAGAAATTRARLDAAGAAPAPAVGQWSYRPALDGGALRVLQSNIESAQQRVADLEARTKAGENVAQELTNARIVESDLRRRMEEVTVVMNAQLQVPAAPARTFTQAPQAGGYVVETDGTVVPARADDQGKRAIYTVAANGSVTVSLPADPAVVNGVRFTRASLSQFDGKQAWLVISANGAIYWQGQAVSLDDFVERLSRLKAIGGSAWVQAADSVRHAQVFGYVMNEVRKAGLTDVFVQSLDPQTPMQPVALAAPGTGTAPGDALIQVTGNGGIWWTGNAGPGGTPPELIPPGQLADLIVLWERMADPARGITVRGDIQARFQDVVRVFDAIKQSGIKRIKFETRTSETLPARVPGPQTAVDGGRAQFVAAMQNARTPDAENAAAVERQLAQNPTDPANARAWAMLPGLYLNLANAAANAKDDAQAREYRLRAISAYERAETASGLLSGTNGGDPTVSILNLAKTYSDIGQPEKGADVMLEALRGGRINPALTERAWGFAATFVKQSEKPDRGIAVLKEAAAKFSQNGVFDLQLAQEYFGANRTEEGMAALREAERKGVPGREGLLRLTAATGEGIPVTAAATRAATGSATIFPTDLITYAVRPDQIQQVRTMTPEAMARELREVSRIQADLSLGGRATLTAAVTKGDWDYRVDAIAASDAVMVTVMVNGPGSPPSTFQPGAGPGRVPALALKPGASMVAVRDLELAQRRQGGGPMAMEATVQVVSVGAAKPALPGGTIIVLGQVNTPGKIQLPTDRRIPVMEAVNLAGGFTRLSNRSNVMLTRIKPDGTKERFSIDVQGMLDGRINPMTAPEIQPNDIVNVPERLF
jgi:biopolymer transport protein ExbD/tetratricopeptide (TPR) repeat protein